MHLEAVTDSELIALIPEIVNVSAQGYHDDMGYPRVAARRAARLQIDRIFGAETPHIPDDHAVFVARDNGEDCGYVWVGPVAGHGTSCYIYFLEVAQAHRGEGVGRFLLDGVEDWARERGYDDMNLNVFASNYVAHDLYVQSGFTSSSKYMRKHVSREIPEPIRDVPRGLFRDGQPVIIVPLFGKATALKHDLYAAYHKGADMIEWRADLTDDWESVKDVIEHAPLPVVITLRSAIERGLYEGDYGVVADLCTWKVAAIDIECYRDEAPELIRIARENGLTVIGSHHDFDGTPDEQTMKQTVRHMIDLGVDVVKLAYMPDNNDDIFRQMTALKDVDFPLINIAMGKLGKWTRLVPATCGSVATFAAFKHETAPGQVPIAAVRGAVNACAD